MEAEDDDIRFENELKRMKLHLEHGLDLTNNPGLEDLPPEVEGQFLDYVAAFEKAFHSAVQTTIGKMLGEPAWRPVAEIPDDEIGQVLDDAMNLLVDHNISLGTLYDVEERELYRFISEEMMAVEIDDMNLPGMMTCFTYEEFHPNHLRDLVKLTGDFLDRYLQKSDEPKWESEVLPELVHDPRLRGFWEGFDDFQDIQLQVGEVRLDGERAWVAIDGSFIGLVGGESVHFSGHGELEFILHYGWWIIAAVTLPPASEILGE